MNREFLKTILVVAGAILFNIIFWQEKLAVNAIIFDVFVLWSVFYLYPSVLSKKEIRWLLPAHLITVVAVVVHNTVVSKLAFSSTLLLIVAFSQYMHRSAWYAAGSVLTNYLTMVFVFFENIAAIKKNKISFKGIKKLLRLLVIPISISGAFLLLYSFANTVFNDILLAISTVLQNWFSRIFGWFNWERFTFLMLGLFVTGGMLLKSKTAYFSDKDVAHTNELIRKKNDLKKWQQSGLFDLLKLFMGRFANGMMALRNENKTGLISLVLLNVLLLFINIIDVIYVWFGFKYAPNLNLSAYVHEGAGLLIFSIILAMLVLLFFFRGNLNFYKKNKWLRYGAYAWILQNIILVISVLIRDYYYFVHMGMAYKRIGVIIFLALVLCGLVTVFIKIHFKKSNYYLFRVNAWFAIGMLVISSCIHWDEWIASHNLSRKGEIPLDVKFLLSLSDKTLPIIEQNKDVLEDSFISIHNGDEDYLYRGRMTPKEFFEQRKHDFFNKQQTYTWLSWNVSDEYVKKHLPKQLTASLK